MRIALLSLSIAFLTVLATAEEASVPGVSGAGDVADSVETQSEGVSETATATEPQEQKRLGIRVARKPVAHPSNRESVSNWRDNLRRRREALQQLGMSGALTTTEMAEMGELLRQAELEVENMASLSGPMTATQRRSMGKMFEKLRDQTLNKQFNSAFDGTMTEERLNEMSGRRIAKYRDDVKKFNEVAEDVDPEDRREVRDIQREIGDLLKSSAKDGTRDTPEVRQKLAKLRAQFNSATNRAEKRAERARERAQSEASEGAERRPAARGSRSRSLIQKGIQN